MADKLMSWVGAAWAALEGLWQEREPATETARESATATPAKAFSVEDLMEETKVDRDLGPPLEVVATTPRLRLRSCRESDVPFYQALWSNPDVMKKYASGRPQTDPEYAYKRLVSNENSWTQRWAEGNPWSGMVVELLSTNEPIGAVVVGGGELAYLFEPNFHGQGYGREAVVALVNVVVPMLALDTSTPNIPKSIEATVRADHVPSRRILETCGFTSDLKINYREFDGEMFERYIFTVDVSTLIARYLHAREDW